MLEHIPLVLTITTVFSGLFGAYLSYRGKRIDWTIYQKEEELESHSRMYFDLRKRFEELKVNKPMILSGESAKVYDRYGSTEEFILWLDHELELEELNVVKN